MCCSGSRGVKAKKSIKNARRVIRKSTMAYAIRQILLASVGATCSLFAYASADALPVGNVKFNSAFIHGESVDVSRFYTGNPNPVGEYVVRVSVNGDSRGQHEVSFRRVNEGISAQPCFTEAELTRLGIKFSARPLAAQPDSDDDLGDPTPCATIDQWVAGAGAEYAFGDFHLALTIPQAYLVRFPRGYTDPGSWQQGVTVALLDYNANLYAQKNAGLFAHDANHAVNGNLAMQTGLNFYKWRLRKRLNTSWRSGEPVHTRSLLTYLQRDVPALQSQLTLGDSTTSGDLFDSLTVRGIQLQSDDRMLPDGLRSYSPLIRGTAETNARVQVTQRGQLLYETTVPAGPFELRDVGAMGYGGDLQVTVIEADGRRLTQVVPFSAPPMLLHQGVSRFGVAVGKVQDNVLAEEPGLAQIFYQYGLGNLYTLYGGSQIADNYVAAGIGNAFNTPLGGVSMDITRARSDLGDGKSSAGNSYNLAFSKHLETTSTDVTLAAWRYTSKGFYSLRDAALERYGTRNDDGRVDYRTRQRFTVSLGQPLWDGARINLSGSFYNYWNERSSASQYTLSYNQSGRYFSWALSASRAWSRNGEDVNSVMLSVNVPFGRGNMVDKPAFSSLYSTVSRDSDGSNALQVNAIGSQGEQNELGYGIGATVSKARNTRASSTFNGNISYNSPVGEVSSTASLGDKSSQLSFSANGSLVGHDGGLTAGPRLGDAPFALVEAPGAEGARILNGKGSQIDARGYAVLPSLTAYRANSVGVDTRGLPATVDVLESESTVIPRMGAAIKVRMKTQIGEPVVLIVKDPQGKVLPIGADIYDEADNNLGIIGQGGMAFVRGWQAEKNNLYVKNSSGQRLCTIYSDSSVARTIINAQGAVTQVGVLCH